MEKRNEKPGWPSSGEALRALLERGGITPKAFAEQMGVSPQALNNWFSRGVPVAKLPDVAKALGVSRAVLMGVAELDKDTDVVLGPWSNEAPVRKQDRTVADYPSRIINVPIFERGLFNDYVLEDVEIEQSLSIERNWLMRQGFGATVVNKMALAHATGDHMAPTINDGDLMLFEVGGGPFVQDGVYIYTYGSGSFFKRLQAGKGSSIFLLNDNKSYRDQEVNVEDIGIFAKILMVLNCRHL